MLLDAIEITCFQHKPVITLFTELILTRFRQVLSLAWEKQNNSFTLEKMNEITGKLDKLILYMHIFPDRLALLSSKYFPSFTDAFLLDKSLKESQNQEPGPANPATPTENRPQTDAPAPDQGPGNGHVVVAPSLDEVEAAEKEQIKSNGLHLIFMLLSCCL